MNNELPINAKKLAKVLYLQYCCKNTDEKLDKISVFTTALKNNIHQRMLYKFLRQLKKLFDKDLQAEILIIDFIKNELEEVDIEAFIRQVRNVPKDILSAKIKETLIRELT